MKVATFFSAGAVVGGTSVGATTGTSVGCTTGGASVTTGVAVCEVAQADKINVAIIMMVNKICLRCMFSSKIMLYIGYYFPNRLNRDRMIYSSIDFLTVTSVCAVSISFNRSGMGYFKLFRYYSIFYHFLPITFLWFYMYN
jgi:hypothetical protein